VERVPDHGLDQLLDLGGEVLVISEDGQYWVKFDVRRVPATVSKPHGLDYSLTLHGPGNQRVLGYDNAHPVPPGTWGAPHDHRHGHMTVKPYDYESAAALLEAFWADVDAYLDDPGVER
jgi:hypothetical protein